MVKKEKKKRSFAVSKFNNLQHGGYSKLLKEMPCTKRNCPVYKECPDGKKEKVKDCILRKEAALGLLKRGFDPLKINWDLLVKSMVWFEVNSFREHVNGEPGEGTRKWAETINKIVANSAIIEKSKKSSGDTAQSFAEIMEGAQKILEKKKIEQQKREATDTDGCVEEY